MAADCVADAQGGLKMKRYLALVTVVLALVGLVACGSAAQDAAPIDTTTPGQATGLDGATILAEKCGSCHDTSKVDGVQNDAVGWAAVIDDMIAKGADVSADEEAALAEYLANR